MIISTKKILLQFDQIEITTYSFEPKFLYWFRFYLKVRRLGYDKGSALYLISQAKHVAALQEGRYPSNQKKQILANGCDSYKKHLKNRKAQGYKGD